MTGLTTADTFAVTGTNAFTSSLIAFSAIENVAGNTGTDTVTGTSLADAITIDGPNAVTTSSIAFTFIEAMDGAGGSDTVTGLTSNEIFTVTGANAFTSSSVAFSFIEAVAGNTGTDTVVATSLADAITIDGPNAVTTSSIAFTAIEALDGSGGSDTVTGLAGNDAFAVTGASAFTSSGVAFSAIESIAGNTGTDTLNVSGAAGEIVDLGSSSTSSIGAFTGIEIFSGNANDNVLAGGVSWTINGVNDGAVDTFTFVNFSILEGTTGDDTFILLNDGASTFGAITGSLDGLGAGADFDTLDLTGAPGESLGSGSTTHIALFTDIENIIGGVTNVLTGSVWYFDGLNSGIVDTSCSPASVTSRAQPATTASHSITTAPRRPVRCRASSMDWAVWTCSTSAR